MTDVQPEPGREPDPSVTTPQPDENPEQRENLREQAQRQPGEEDPAPPIHLDNDAGPNDDPQDHDALQQQARRETSKAEGEDPDRDQPSTTPPIANPD